ncbi:MAG: hypothetical protein ABSD73_03160 [Candidatus Bathyarchaeia archaeon]|jgi:hypothetical protein
MLNEVKEDRAHPNKRKAKEPATRPNAEVIDWFLAIDLIHV